MLSYDAAYETFKSHFCTCILEDYFLDANLQLFDFVDSRASLLNILKLKCKGVDCDKKSDYSFEKDRIAQFLAAILNEKNPIHRGFEFLQLMRLIRARMNFIKLNSTIVDNMNWNNFKNDTQNVNTRVSRCLEKDKKIEILRILSPVLPTVLSSIILDFEPHVLWKISIHLYSQFGWGNTLTSCGATLIESIDGFLPKQFDNSLGGDQLIQQIEVAILSISSYMQDTHNGP